MLMPKALPRFTSAEIENYLEGGELDKLNELLEEKLKEAHEASDGTVAVQFFIEHEEDEVEEEEDDPDARRQQKIDDAADLKDEDNADD